jgi:hypothetical protein
MGSAKQLIQRSGAEDFSDRFLRHTLTYVMNIWMDQIEQRVIVKDSFLKGHGSKLIQKELVSPFQYNAISLSTIKIVSRDSNPVIFPAATKNGLEDL